MQTLFEAEQVCAELQHSVSGLDSRLAELLHWETEARELYQLLRATDRQKQKGQDPRAKVRPPAQVLVLRPFRKYDNSTPFFSAGPHFSWSTAGGSGGH